MRFALKCYDTQLSLIRFTRAVFIFYNSINVLSKKQYLMKTRPTISLLNLDSAARIDCESLRHSLDSAARIDCKSLRHSLDSAARIDCKSLRHSLGSAARIDCESLRHSLDSAVGIVVKEPKALNLGVIFLFFPKERCHPTVRGRSKITPRFNVLDSHS
jgi:hypothetical protein